MDDSLKFIGKKIVGLSLLDDTLSIKFNDGVLTIWDNGQSCCEVRYMSTDEPLDHYVGSIFYGCSVTGGSDGDEEYDVHETQFLQVLTSVGIIDFVNHNEHNGYYGGFSIKMKGQINA